MYGLGSNSCSNRNLTQYGSNRFLFDDLLPQVKKLDGFVSAEVLHRPDGDEIAWITLLQFESMDCIQRFAGRNPEQAVVEPEALALLSRHDAVVSHFETRRLV